MEKHGEILRNLAKEKGVSRDEIKLAFGKSDAQGVYNLYKKDKFNRPEIITACMLLNCQPGVFPVKKEDEDGYNFFTSKYFQQFIQDLRGDLSIESKSAYDDRNQKNTPQTAGEEFSFDQLSFEKAESSLEGYKDFVRCYFESLAIFVEEARNSIDVMAYLSYKRFPYRMKVDPARLDLYAGARKNYFTRIEKHIAHHPQLTYRRIMQIEVGDRLNWSQENHLARAIRIMNPETFKHTLRCYEISQKESQTANFELYLAVNFVRPFTYIIIDGKAILTEYDRYKINGESQPDLRFINRIKAKSQQEYQLDEVHKLIQTHQKDIERVVSKNQDREREKGISEERFKQALWLAFRQLRDEERKLNEAIEERQKKYHQLTAKAAEQETEEKEPDADLQIKIEEALAGLEDAYTQKERIDKERKGLRDKLNLLRNAARP